MFKNKPKDIYWFAVFIVLSLLFYYSTGLALVKDFRGLLEKPFLFIQTTATQFKQRFSLTKKIASLSDFKVGEKESLENQIKDLNLKVGKLSVCLEENEARRRLLAAPLPPTWHFIPVKSISFYQKIKINAGEKAGIEKGMTVISENYLLGRIESTEKFSAVVILVTDPAIKIPVIVRNPGVAGIRAKGILSGYFGDQMVLEEVLKSEKISEGDFVYTSGEADWLPDLLIGKIEKIQPEKEKVFQTAWVRSFLNYQNLRYLFVVKMI